MSVPAATLDSKTTTTVAMKGGGYYSQRTLGAKHVIDKATPMLLDAIAALPEPPAGQPLHIADFGAADGGTSLEALYRVVEAARARMPDRQILITYTDLPSNDFSQLFRTALGLDGDPALSAIKSFDGVFVHACGIGFHQQLVPDASLDLGFSATAMHYVSDKPCEIEDHVHMVGASGDTLAAYAEQAAADWERILLARAAELRPGGRLVFMNFGKDEAGRHLGHTGGVNMFDTFNKHWAAMRDEGLITADEYRDASFPQFYRTVDEFCAPFNDAQSAVSRAGLRLVSAQTGVVRCPYQQAFEAANGAMDPRSFARSLIPTMRSWSETVFANALDPARPADARFALVDQFYQRYEDEVAASPQGHAMDYVHCYLAAEKVS
ncbi:MAG: SAM-dependent methyltransferase [Pseudomonadota bacterium]